MSWTVTINEGNWLGRVYSIASVILTVVVVAGAVIIVVVAVARSEYISMCLLYMELCLRYIRMGVI